jgi:tight adherence protein C
MSIALVTIATFLGFATTALLLFRALSGESQVTRRVKGLVDPPMGPAARARKQRTSRVGLVGRMLTGIGQYGPEGDRSLSRRLAVAGFRGPNAAKVFLGARTVISVGPALLFLVPAVSAGDPLGHALAVPLFVWLGGHMLANLLLKRRARIRASQITKALPDALDLMVVCLEAGLGLNATIAKVGDERSTIEDILGDEFAQVALELRNGRTREEALRALGQRNGSDDLKALVALIIQSDRLGASLARTLRTHSDLLRTKRRQRAEEAARKLPIKMLFPLASLILPALFIVTTGPALLTLANLGAMMGAH